LSIISDLFIQYFLLQVLEVLVHACYSSYAGSKDQEDCTLKPAWTKRKTPISTSKSGMVATHL
jgi:hypothetical protein